MAKPSRNDLTPESRTVLRGVIWCAAVFALAIVITTLNFLPPVEVHYTVRNRVLLSPQRLEKLEAAIRDEKATWNEGPQNTVRLTGIEVLDRSDADGSGSAPTSGNEPMALVEIRSIWKSGYSEEKQRQWLDELSRGTTIGDISPDAERESLVARWELETAKHYLARHQFLNRPSDQSQESKPRHTFTLASSSSPAGSNTSWSDSTDSVSVPLQLDATAQALTKLQAELVAAEQKVEQSQQTLEQQAEQASGILEFAKQSILSPKSNRIPLWLAASVIVLGLAAGSSAGWLQFRLQVGNVSDPTIVATQLALDGMPMAGHIVLDSDGDWEGDWRDRASQRARAASFGVARRIARISEWALWIWVYMIAIRFVLDPMWRAVLWDSPLAALGRVVAGMP